MITAINVPWKTLRSLVLAVMTLTVMVPAMVAAAADSEELRFPESKVIERQALDPGEETRVIISQVSEVRDRLRFDEALEVATLGERVLLEVPSSYSPEAVLEHYREQLVTRDARMLFDCEGRACGRSATWANRVFEQSRLYGRDGEQGYLVGAWRDDQNRLRLLAVYVVRRGNRVISVLEQHLELPEDFRLPGAPPRERLVLGPFVIPFEPGTVPELSLDPATGADIGNLSQRYPDAQVYLLGFAPATLGGAEAAMAQAQLALEAGQRLLEGNGVPAQRQQTIALGAAVPIRDPERQGPRLEVTIVRKELNNDE